LPEAIREIARNIVRYLVAHPQAADTLDGVVQWWLLGEGRMLQRASVEHALDWLLAQGLLHETQRVGVPPYYRLNHQNQEAIAAFLQETEEAC
jgi:DNA-binding transcriptional ArsR family regulator